MLFTFILFNKQTNIRMKVGGAATHFLDCSWLYVSYEKLCDSLNVMKLYSLAFSQKLKHYLSKGDNDEQAIIGVPKVITPHLLPILFVLFCPLDCVKILYKLEFFIY